MTKEQRLIQRLAEAVAEVNECSELLSKENIYVHIMHLGREAHSGDRIELRDVLLHKSLLREKLNDSK